MIILAMAVLGAAVAEEVEWSPTNWRGGGVIPGPS